MSSRSRLGGRILRLLAVVSALTVLGAGLAAGERSQKGDLIVFLDGGISPLALPRDRPAPIALQLRGGLRREGGGLLPRVTRVEIGLPAQGVLSTRGLPICRQQRLRNTRPGEALDACRGALVGHGHLRAHVRVPNQDPFAISARLLAFNGRSGRHRAVIVHAYAADPPTVVVLPFYLHRRKGRFGLALTANLSRALGPWPHFARFDLTLFRRYSYRGRTRSYLSSSCPIPRRNTAGFFSLARISFRLADGGRITQGIARGCRAR